MKSTLIAAGSVLAASAGVAATEGVVQWPIARGQSYPHVNRRAAKRDTVVTPLQNAKILGAYFADVEVGTPAQKLTLQVDTGSSDVWVPSSNAALCAGSSSGGGSCNLGSFDEDKSRTLTVVGEDEFNITYVDRSHSVGSYISDVFKIGGSTLSNLTMGLGVDTDINYGLVGIAYQADEAIVIDAQDPSLAYSNLPLAMVEQGLISTVAYSLWLNDLSASTGNLLFGGIDTKKYHGDLTRIAVLPDRGAYTAFLVGLTSLQAFSPSGSDTLTSESFPVPAVLDSGTTISYLPQDLAEQVWKEAGAVYSAAAKGPVLPCSLANSKGYFSFGFGGPGGAIINVTMDELVVGQPAGGPLTFPDGPHKGEAVCAFGIENTTDSESLLGDTFLRSAYVVYDLVNNEIALAQTDFNATDSNVVAFPSSGAPIPSATVAPSQSVASQTAAVTEPAYAASSGFAATGTKAATGTGTATSSSSPSSGGSSKGAAGANAVPMDLLRLTAIAATMFVAGGLLIL